jgi:hypothetical protein
LFAVGAFACPSEQPLNDDDATDDDDVVDDDDDAAPPAWVFPVGASDTLAFRLNDTFGPRILSSQGVYDFHRGIDISRPVGTLVVAVADGTVRFASMDHPGYADPTVQLWHPQDDGSMLISHYTHLSAVEPLQEDAVITQGDPIGLVGQGSASYAHLHFELRESNGTNSLQRNAVHPLAVLPYPDAAAPTVVIDATLREGTALQVETTVSALPEEMDIVSVEVVVTADGVQVAEASWDMNAWNAGHEDTASLDQAELDGMRLDPAEFNDNGQYPTWVLGVDFLDIEVPAQGALVVDVVVADAAGGTATASTSVE